MTTIAFDIQTYLERVAMDSPPPLTAEGLMRLVRAQSRAIAFENLDTLAGIPVRLEAGSLARKLLHARRGGYCYELNGLLALAMEAIGFRFRLGLARVTYRRTEPGPLSHLVILAECDGGEWLVDAGFGGPGLIEPIPFRADEEYLQQGSHFRLVPAPHGDLELQRRVSDEWFGLYAIAPHRILPVDIEIANHVTATWERSPFHTVFMCARPVETGLILIQGEHLVMLDRHLDEVSRQPINSARELRDIMRLHFDIQVDERTAARAWTTVMLKSIDRT